MKLKEISRYYKDYIGWCYIRTHYFSDNKHERIYTYINENNNQESIEVTIIYKIK